MERKHDWLKIWFAWKKPKPILFHEADHQNMQPIPLDRVYVPWIPAYQEMPSLCSLQLRRQVCHMKGVRPGSKKRNNIYLDYKMYTTEMEPIQASKQLQ